MKNKFTFLLLVVMTVFMTASCYKERLHLDEIKKSSWQADWAMPIAKAELSLRGILGDSTGIIHTDNNGFISLVYESQHLIHIEAKDYLHLDDISSASSVDFNLPAIPPGITVDLPPIELLIPLEVEGKRIDSLLLNQGNLQLTLNTNLNKEQASLNLEIPSLRNANGEALNLAFDLSNSSGGELNLQQTQNLENYRILTIEDNNQRKLKLILHMSITGDNNPDNSPYTLEIQSAFQDMDIHAFYGYFGNENITFHDTIPLGIFNSTYSGNIGFGPDNIHFSMDADNSFGIPIRLDITDSKAHRINTPASEVNLYFLGEGNPQTISILAPGYAEIGQTKHTHIDASSSNINEAIAISPQYVSLGIEGILNPNNDPGDVNFILDNSSFDASFKIQMDLFGSINGFILADTIPLKNGIPENLQNVELAFDITNGFPLEASLEISLHDSVYQYWQTIRDINELFVEGAPVSGPPDYKVTAPATKLSTISLADSITSHFSNFDKLIIRSAISTTNGDLIKVYDDYQISVKVGAKFKTSIQ